MRCVRLSNRVADFTLRYFLSGRYLPAPAVRRAALHLLAYGDEAQVDVAVSAYERLCPRVTSRILRDAAGYADPELGLSPEFDGERWDGLA